MEFQPTHRTELNSCDNADNACPDFYPRLYFLNPNIILVLSTSR